MSRGYGGPFEPPAEKEAKRKKQLAEAQAAQELKDALEKEAQRLAKQKHQRKLKEKKERKPGVTPEFFGPDAKRQVQKDLPSDESSNES